MDVGMAALAVAFLSSMSLGFLLCVSFWGMRLFIKLIAGTRSGKVTYECWLFIRIVWVSVCVIVFLYATNRGVLRWFLLAGVVFTCLLSERLFGRSAARVTDNVVLQVRRAVFRVALWLTAPVRAAARLIGHQIFRLMREIGLRTCAFCDKMTTQRYDKTKRSRSDRAVRMEVSELLGGTT